MSSLLQFSELEKGTKITANINGKVRGGEILEVVDGNRILAEFYTPSRVERLLEKNDFVLSKNYQRGQLK